MNEQYKLSNGWRWVKLGEVIQEYLPGFACGIREDTNGFIQLRMNNISTKGFLDLSSTLKVPATEEQVKKYKLQPKDVIFNNTNSVELVGKTALFNETNGIFLYSNHLTRLRPKPNVLDSRFLTFWLQLQWYRRVFEINCNRWIGQAAVTRDKFCSFDIPLPPIEEQQRIAGKIEKMMEEINQAKEACEKQLEAAQSLSSAYLRETFESPESKKWERKKLGEILETIESGKRPKGGVSNIKEGIPSIGAEHLNSFAGFNLNNIRYIPEDFYEKMNKGKIKQQDVLVVKDGATTGKVSFVDDKFPFKHAAVNEHVFILRTKAFIKQEFLFWFLSSPFGQAQIQKEFHGAAQGGINQQFIDNIEIPVPGIEIQIKIIDNLKSKINALENLKVAISNQLSTINALPQAILSKAFRGEL